MAVPSVGSKSEQDLFVSSESSNAVASSTPATKTNEVASSRDHVQAFTGNGPGKFASAADDSSQPYSGSFSAGALAASGGCVPANRPVAPGSEPSDFTCFIGNREYYRARHDDFLKRHPGETPPAYYLEYGEKYARAFTMETYDKLSPQGQQWLMRTFENLQTRIEEKRAQDPAAFDRLERDPAAFKAFAYDTHPDAYLESGLKDLPEMDKLRIGLTPDVADMFSPDGLKQVGRVAGPLVRDYADKASDGLRNAF